MTKLLKIPENANLTVESDFLWKKEYKDYYVEKHVIYPEPYSAVPFLVMIPKNICKETLCPGVLCISGSSGTKELLTNEPELDGKPTSNKHPNHNKMAWHYVQAGYIAVAVENPGVGELKSKNSDIWNDRSEFSARMLMMGRNYIGISTHQKLCILEWMKKNKLIDSDKIAVSAHSLGAEPAVMLALLTKDIKAVIYNDFIGNRLNRKNALKSGEILGGFWHEIPDMFEWFTYIDLLCACAPKPILFTEGGITADLDIIKRSYEKSFALKNLNIYYYKKYQDPKARIHEYEELPNNIKLKEYFEYANIDVENHFFKEYHAIPWLNKVFSYSK